MTSTLTATDCPLCKSGKMSELQEVERFPYGDEGAEIEAIVPVLRCQGCDFAITDERAEKIRHAAVCSHLGLLSPEEILNIRKGLLNMSRDAFHEAYGLSAASMERWENGKLFQSEAADTLLRAIQDPEQARRLDRRTSSRTYTGSYSSGENVVWGRFPALEKSPAAIEDAVERSRKFDLRIRAA